MKLQQDTGACRDTKNILFLVDLFVRNNNFSKDSQDTYKSHLRRFLKQIPNAVTDITLEHVEADIMRYSKRVAANTANIHICILKSFFAWLCRNGHSDLEIRINLFPALDSEQRILSQEEYEMVVGKCQDDYKKDIFVFLCNTGLRVSEFLRLAPENFKGDFIRVVGPPPEMADGEI